MDNVNVLYKDMPCRIHSYVVKNDDMTYTIVLNSRLSNEQNLQSYIHEMSHITNSDFSKENSDIIERASHFLEIAAELCL